MTSIKNADVCYSGNSVVPGRAEAIITSPTRANSSPPEKETPFGFQTGSQVGAGADFLPARRVGRPRPRPASGGLPARGSCGPRVEPAFPETLGLVLVMMYLFVAALGVCSHWLEVLDASTPYLSQRASVGIRRSGNVAAGLSRLFGSRKLADAKGRGRVAATAAARVQAARAVAEAIPGRRLRNTG
jgi:hypothetical protein